LKITTLAHCDAVWGGRQPPHLVPTPCAFATNTCVATAAAISERGADSARVGDAARPPESENQDREDGWWDETKFRLTRLNGYICYISDIHYTVTVSPAFRQLQISDFEKRFEKP
jgi:hypothetical protein